MNAGSVSTSAGEATIPSLSQSHVKQHGLLPGNSTHVQVINTSSSLGRSKMGKDSVNGSFSQLKDLLSHLASVKGDLSNITAPPFVLASKSAIETPSCWASRHKLFLQPTTEPDPERRVLLVTKNYLCSLKQLASGDLDGTVKKPLNPFLGEIFLGHFEDDNGNTTQLIAEQVSHHPPVTACSLYNEHHGISSNGFVAQETSFSPTSGVIVKQIGYAVVSDERHNEKHLMTMPTLVVKGLATGQPYPELEGPCYISSSGGYFSEINLEGKGKLGFSSKNRVNAEVYRASDKKELLYRITGQWTGQMRIEDAKGNAVEEFDVDDIPLATLNVPPLSEQTPWESRRAWSRVVEGVNEGDVEKVNEFKNAIEEAQRERRAKEERDGTEWTGLFFTRKSEEDAKVRQLANSIPDAEILDSARTNGVWHFVGVKDAENTTRRLSRNPSWAPDGHRQ